MKNKKIHQMVFEHRTFVKCSNHQPMGTRASADTIVHNILICYSILVHNTLLNGLAGNYYFYYIDEDFFMMT